MDTVAVIRVVNVRGFVICATPVLFGKITPTCELPTKKLEADALVSHLSVPKPIMVLPVCKHSSTDNRNCCQYANDGHDYHQFDKRKSVFR